MHFQRHCLLDKEIISMAPAPKRIYGKNREPVIL